MSRKAELQNKLEGKKFYKLWTVRNYSDKSFSTMLNRADRRHSKMTLDKNLNTYYCDDNSVSKIYLGESDEITRENHEDGNFFNWSSNSGWGHDPYPFRYAHKKSARWEMW